MLSVNQDTGILPGLVTDQVFGFLAVGGFRQIPKSRNSFDPEENIRGGMKHMRNLLNMFDNDLVLSLAAYNAGENLVQRTGRVPGFRETHDYVRSITRRYGRSHLVPPNETPPAPLLMFKYMDRDGVLHLTNIPPVQGSESSVAVGPPGQSP